MSVLRRTARLLLVAIAGGLLSAGFAAAAPLVAISETEGVPFTASLGDFTTTCQQFIEKGGCAFPDIAGISIDWGDGTSSAGTYAEVGGCNDPCTVLTYSVSGTHTYTEAGSYSIIGTWHGDWGGKPATGGASGGSATVANQPLTSGAASALSAQVGVPFSGPVATFTDGNPFGGVGDYSATINWGDGSTSPGTIGTAAGGRFQVTGNHVYQGKLSSASVTVAVTDSGQVFSMLPDTLSVVDPPLTPISSAVAAFQGIPFTGMVGRFTDPNTLASPGDFAATIAWGDGGTSPGTVTAAPGGGFEVTGSHTYASAGSPTVTSRVSYRGDPPTTITSFGQVGAPLAPKTSILLTPAAPSGQQGWYTTGVNVDVVADGLGLPVAATRCELDPGAPPATFDAMAPVCSFTGTGNSVTGDGRHSVWAASVNTPGQRETPASVTFSIDRTPPAVTCDASPTFVRGGSDENVLATVADQTSGPRSTTVSAPAMVGSTGVKAAVLTGYDNAGNRSSTDCRYRVLGHLDSALGWVVDPHQRYTEVPYLEAKRVPLGSVIEVLCKGGGCPFASHRVRVTAPRNCPKTKTCRHAKPPTTESVNLVKPFHDRHLAPRSRLQVSIAQANTFGNTWMFTIRAGRDPIEQTACLSPGSFVKQYPNC